MSGNEEESKVKVSDDGEMEIDFTDPAYILQNLRYEGNFEKFDNFSSAKRTRAITNMCDQVCFYIACILKSFKDTERPPTIWIYGAGFVGSTIIESLSECGCKPLLKIFGRDEAAINSWRAKGFRAVSQMPDGKFLDIVIICSNLASFSQLCRDISDFVSPKTCLISTVFGLQRGRLFNILRTPAIFRTFVEREAPLYDVGEGLEGAPALSPSAGRKTGVTGGLGGSGSGSPYAPPRSSRQNKRSPFPSVGPARAAATPLSPVEVSARFLASRKNAVRNMIVLLENYYIMSGIPAPAARMQALTAVVGADAVQPVDRPPSSETVTGAPGGTADDDSNSATSIHTDPSRRRVEVLSEAGLPSQADLLMPDILARLHEKYCRHFQRELSKHILVLDLPRIADDSSPAGSPAARTRKNPRNTIGRMPTRGTRAVMGTPLSNWELRFMSDELLTRLFKMDSKSAYINDRKNEYLEELDAASDEEDGKKQSRGASREGGADRAAAPRTVATERFYIQRYDSFADASSTVGVMASLSKPCFMDLGGFATDR